MFGSPDFWLFISSLVALATLVLALWALHRRCAPLSPPTAPPHDHLIAPTPRSVRKGS